MLPVIARRHGRRARVPALPRGGPVILPNPAVGGAERGAAQSARWMGPLPSAGVAEQIRTSSAATGAVGSRP